MKKLCLTLLVIGAFFNSLPAASEYGIVFAKAQELERCLIEYWGVDQGTAVYVRNILGPLLEDTACHATIDDFICKSKNLNLDFAPQKMIAPLTTQDGVFQAPNQHLVVFENPWVRVLWGSTKPGDRESLHIHEWKRILIIIKSTTFEVTYADGTVAIQHWPIGVYELPGMEQYSCINIGNSADECLGFEVK